MAAGEPETRTELGGRKPAVCRKNWAISAIRELDNVNWRSLIETEDWPSINGIIFKPLSGLLGIPQDRPDGDMYKEKEKRKEADL